MEFDEERSTTFREENIPSFQNRGFFLTDEKTAFKCVIFNPSEEVQSGIIPINWTFRPPETQKTRLVRFSLKPGETKRYDILEGWIATPGTGRYDLIFYPNHPPEAIERQTVTKEDWPEEGSIEGFGRVNIPPSPLRETLVSYQVKDKSTYEYEENKRQLELSLVEKETEMTERTIVLNKRLLWLTWAIALFTVVLVLREFEFFSWLITQLK